MPELYVIIFGILFILTILGVTGYVIYVSIENVYYMVKYANNDDFISESPVIENKIPILPIDIKPDTIAVTGNTDEIVKQQTEITMPIQKPDDTAICKSEPMPESVIEIENIKEEIIEDKRYIDPLLHIVAADITFSTLKYSHIMLAQDISHKYNIGTTRAENIVSVLEHVGIISSLQNQERVRINYQLPQIENLLNIYENDDNWATNVDIVNALDDLKKLSQYKLSDFWRLARFYVEKCTCDTHVELLDSHSIIGGNGRNAEIHKQLKAQYIIKSGYYKIVCAYDTLEELEHRRMIELKGTPEEKTAELERARKILNERSEEAETKERERRKKIAEEKEREEITHKIKERYRRRQLEKIIRQELIDSGELFGDQPKRPPIPREVVDAVYSRDGGRCVYCGSTENLQLDHIIPFSKGGATTLENLQLLCQKCNLEKSNKIG